MRAMNVLIILGSPRKHGNSEILARHVGESIKKSGGAVDFIRLNSLNISPCQGCGGCDKTGICVIKDDMTELYTRVDVADALLLVSPVYFYGVTAQCKGFIDRFQARWSRKYVQNIAYRAGEGRRGYFLSTSATHGGKMSECCMYTARYFFDAIQLEFDAEDSLLVHGVDEKGAVVQRQGSMQDAEAFGRKIASRE